MKSLTDLTALAEETPGVEVPEGASREQIMDLLRAVTGTFDPDLQIDPAKAKDLKNKIDWAADGPARFATIAEFLTPAWALEPKLDGARMRVFLGSSGNTMNTGRRSDVTFAYTERAENFPHLRDAVVPALTGTILDGELMPPKDSITTQSGVVTKGTLNSAMALVNVSPEKSVATQEREGKAIFVAFDILAVQGDSTLHLPWEERRALLERTIEALREIEPCFQITTVMEATPENVDACLENGFEGGMLKKRSAPYRPGKRMAEWQKVKRMSTGDFFIIGSVDGKGRNEGKVGSLKVAYTGPDGEERYCADVAGITDAFRDELTGPDGKVASEFVGKVIEIMGQGRTKNERIRHPHFVCLRPDKTPEDCGRDQLELFEEV